jgi:cation:H+ antiporter
MGRKKDTLALGNLTGAMVFQGCIPVAFGIIATPWVLDGITMISAALAFSSAALNLLWLRAKREISYLMLMSGGVMYLAFLILAFK